MMRVCPVCFEVFGLEHTACPQCGSDLATAQRFDASDPVALLVDALRHRWQESDVAAAIVRALGAFRGRAVDDALTAGLHHESASVRMAAADCLRRRSRDAS